MVSEMDENQVQFRFYEELNDFLPLVKKKISFPYTFNGNPSVKDAIEALGIPHVEVDLIIVNGISVGFSYKLRNNDQISVYPVFESLDISVINHLRPAPLRDLKFITDVHLGKLSKYLRLSGFDTTFKDDLADNEIISISLKEKRIILTRDKNLLKNKNVTHGYWVRSQKPDTQLKEVLQTFDLFKLARPFTRCLECNELVLEVPKSEILDGLKLKTKEFYSDFWKCPGCNRIYWKGSHYESMKKFIDSILL
jgi:uncharacterized protein with PIN domain